MVKPIQVDIHDNPVTINLVLPKGALEKLDLILEKLEQFQINIADLERVSEKISSIDTDVKNTV